jgi:predicted aspartyl protease
LAPVRIGGTDVTMILDSGASATVVDRASAARVGLTGLEVGDVAAGAGGRLETHMASVDDLTLGAVAVAVERVAVMDLSHVNDQLMAIGEARVDGVVGADILNRHAALIDYGPPGLYLRTDEPSPRPADDR